MRAFPLQTPLDPVQMKQHIKIRRADMKTKLETKFDMLWKELGAMVRISMPLAFLFFVLISFTFVAENPVEYQSITETRLLNILRILAHPNLNGRGSSDSGYDCPSKLIAGEFKRYGLKPLGDAIDPKDPFAFGDTRSYFQAFEGKSWISGKVSSRNIIGYIPGETNEFVIIGAHYDHMGGNFPGKEIYHGADDNASGTSATLAIAEAISQVARQQKPKRNILIALWGAEEHGLVGSEHFVTHLPSEIKLENIAVVINLDMVGRNADNELFCILAPEKLDYAKVTPELYALTQELAKEFGFNLTYSNQGFDASDQGSFFDASPPDRRIPVLFFFSGFHPDYHEITDTYDKINYPKLTRVAKMSLRALWSLANAEKRPTYRNTGITQESHAIRHWRGCNRWEEITNVVWK